VIVVKRNHSTWQWRGPIPGDVAFPSRIKVNGWNVGYESSDHALRDAQTWCGRKVPALIYTRRRP